LLGKKESYARENPFLLTRTGPEVLFGHGEFVTVLWSGGSIQLTFEEIVSLFVQEIEFLKIIHTPLYFGAVY